MKVGYLVGIYPRVTHSFIRREILALETMGIEVERFSIRRPLEKLVDQEDLKESEKTRTVLDIGIFGLVFSLLKIFFSKPISFIKALIFTIRIALNADRGIIKHLAYFTEACVLLNWCSKLNVSHIHAHFGTNGATVVLLCHLLGGISYSFTVHGPEEFDRVESISLPEKIKYAAFVVAISTFAKSQLYRWCSYKEYSKIHVVRCGVDEMFLNFPHHSFPDEPRLVCVGRLCTHKAQLLIVEAASQLIAEGLDLKVVLVGGGSIEQELEELIEQLKLTNYVEITGWVSGSEVQKQILNSRAMVLPSFAEGLPVVIMEALGLGRPVITTYIAGIPELVESGVSGWILTPGDVEQIKMAMKEALTLPISQIEEMGKNGAKRVAELHDSRQEAQKLAQLFGSVVK